MTRKFFVTTALPYANGPFHIGHIMEYIQADIWVRFQRMLGNVVHFVCADDAHGAPIMLKAEAEGISAQELVERITADRPRYLQGFHIGFDHWYSTDSPENVALSQDIYRRLKAAGLVYVKAVEQFYDPVKAMFLADRYIKGECPNCHTKDQYADACEVCSIVNSPADLIDPYSTLSGAKPITKTSDHYFFRLSDPKCVEFLSGWLDTPEQVHFIGKDIIYFHTLFWPAMLKFAGPPYKVPDHVYAHGFITVSGEKMSKSRGTGISPLRYLEIGMNPEWLRYYISAKLNSNVEDLDFNPDDFVARVNSDLIGKYVNIASRAASFITKHFGGALEYGGDAALIAREAHDIAFRVAEYYETRDFGKAMREIMGHADRINHDFDAHQPWVLAKDTAKRAELQDVCSRALQGFRLLSILIAPVLPGLAERVAHELFGLDRPFAWSDADVLPVRINSYQHLMTRVDPKQLDALFETDNEPAPAAAPAAASKTARIVSPPAAASDAILANAAAVEGNLISIDDFLRVDLRAAKVLNAELVAGADKLLKLTLDLGELGTRGVFAGIRAAYEPESLVGRLIVVVANLEPRKMRFGVSEGMMLAAGPGGKEIFVLSPDSGAAPGMRIK